MIPVTRNQAIYVDWITTNINAVIGVTILVQLPDGKITRYLRTFTPTAIRTRRVDLVTLTSGFVIAVSVHDNAFNLEWAETHVTIGIAGRTLDATGELQNRLVQLGSGFISRTHQLSYPGGNDNPALEGRGRIFTNVVAAPIAGAEISFTLPVNTRWIVYSHNFNFVTSADVATRRTIFRILDGANLLYEDPESNSQTASLTREHSHTTGIENKSLQSNADVTSHPLILLPLAATIETVTNNIQAADQYSAMNMLVEEFLVR